MNKKAQGALEFLMTYGWAFLVILIMIGALAYFGVLDPSKFLPERCNFGQEFKCADYVISRNNNDVNVGVTLINNKGKIVTLTLNSAAASYCKADGWNSAAPLNNASGTPASITWNPGEKIKLICNKTLTNEPFSSQGQKAKVGISLTYKDLGGEYDHSIDGELYAKVQ